jgi:hypothetical protein
MVKIRENNIGAWWLTVSKLRDIEIPGACPWMRVLMWRWRKLMVFEIAIHKKTPNNWLNGIDKDTKARIRMGVSAICCWTIWNCRSNIIFHKQTGFNLLCEWLCIGSIYGPLSSRWISGPYGYWLQPAPDGCSGLLFPGYWRTAYTNRITQR